MPSPVRAILVISAVLTALLLVLAGGVLFLTAGSTRKPPPPPLSGNAFLHIHPLLSGARPKEELLARFADVLNQAEYRFDPKALGEAQIVSDIYPLALANLVRVEADFNLLRGHRTQALQQLAAVFYLGELQGRTLDGLPGFHMQQAALRGFEYAVLNGCESTSECRLAWECLESLYSRVSIPRWSEMETLVPPELLSNDKPGLEQRLAARQVQYTRLMLLRCAVAAAERRVHTAEFPAGKKEFGPLLPEGLPPDPFLWWGGPLRFRREAEFFRLWSVGPDRRNDGGGLPYDPTNGAISPGDLVLEIPKIRRYPIPTSGTLLTAAELKSGFREGLFLDPFAMEPRPYNMQTPGPLLVYSGGIDSYSEEHDSERAPEVEYDPTNGMRSNGDLILALPVAR